MHQPDEGSPRRSIPRTELVHRLRRRFEPGATVLVAGAGFGKTVTLQQAMAANAAAPSGTDRLLTCTPPLRVASRFADAVRTCVGLAATDAAGPSDPIERIDAAVDHAARRWPLGVALLVDDAHLLEGSEAELLLRHLWSHRPPPVHLVLASRAPMAWLSGARLGAGADEPAEIGEADLRFSADEVAALVAGRPVAVASVEPLAGWPALTDLAATFGISGAAGFVEDEVLSRFGSDERRQLAALAVIGGGDADLVEAACEVEIDITALTERLPMTSLEGEHLLVHPLWADILEGTLTPDEARQVRVRVAQRLLDRGEPEAAATRFAEADEWPGFERAVGATWRGGYVGGARDVVAHWLSLLPEERWDTPTGTTLRGVAARISDSFGDRARDLLEVAVARCREAGDVETEMVALGEYGYLCRARGEIERLIPVMERLGQLARDGVREAEPFVAVAEAAICDVVGDDAGVLQALGRIAPGSLSSEWSSAVSFLRVNALAMLGATEDLDAAAADCRRYAGPQSPLGRYASAGVAWHLGRPIEALTQLPSLPDDQRLTRVEQVVAATRAAIIEATAGRTEDAAASIDLARSLAPDHAHPSFDGKLAVASALLALARHDPAAAADHLRRLLDRHPLDAGGERLLRPGLAVAFVLLPEARAAIEAAPLGPSLLAHLEVGRAVAATLDDSLPVPTRVPPADLVLCTVPLPLAVRLAAAAHARRDLDGAALARRIVAVHGERGRAALRSGADLDDPSLARAARELAALIALPPEDHIELRLLGPVELLLGGERTAHPDWERDLVRALACLLALRGPLTRTGAAEALWPDAPPEVGARNLRTHLGLLRGVLEPNRHAGEGTFVLQVDGDLLSLVGAPHLSVDAIQFREALDHGATGHGPRAALDEALARWRGRPLTDLPDLEWVDEERAALRELFASTSLRDGTASLAGSLPERTIVRALDVLQVDPWSEEAYQLLVAAHAARGDRAAARRALRRAEEMLAELGAAPSPATQSLMRRLHDPESFRAP